MINIIEENKLKPIDLNDLKVDELFVYYVESNWDNNSIYTITKIDEERLYFKNIYPYECQDEASIPLAEVDKYIILLKSYSDESTKEATNFKNELDIQEAFEEAQRVYRLIKEKKTLLLNNQLKIHNKIKEVSKVLKYANKIKLFMDAALVYYEPDNLSFRVVVDDYLEIAIKFPDITITNSQKKSHKIKDLLVYTTINLKTMKISANIQGYRGSVTKEEVHSKYNHSHLRASDCKRISDFCLGDSEMAVLVAEMKTQPITPQKFEFYCGSLDQYVRWESLEGTPHIKFGSISNNSDILNFVSINNLHYYYNKFIDNKVPFKLHYDSINEKFKVTIELNDVLALLPITDTEIIVLKKENNYYSVVDNGVLENEARASISTRNTYYFDGVKSPELYIPSEEIVTEVKYYPHPSLISFIQNKLEEEAQKHLILTQ